MNTQMVFGANGPARRCVISNDGEHRYQLSETWGMGDRLLWIMLNPSTADGSVDDPTIRKVRGFTQRQAFMGWDVANLFAFRATCPDALRGILRHNPARAMGLRNDLYLGKLAENAHTIAVAWGATPWAENRATIVLATLRALKKPIVCLGVTKSGAPRHPLMVSYRQVLEPYT